MRLNLLIGILLVAVTVAPAASTPPPQATVQAFPNEKDAATANAKTKAGSKLVRKRNSKKRRAKAQTLFEEALKLDPRSDARYELARLHAASSETAKSSKLLLAQVPLCSACERFILRAADDKAFKAVAATKEFQERWQSLAKNKVTMGFVSRFFTRMQSYETSAKELIKTAVDRGLAVRVDAAERDQGSKADTSTTRYIRSKADLAELDKSFPGAVGTRGPFKWPKKITCRHRCCELKHKHPCDSKPRVTRLCYQPVGKSFALVDLTYRLCQATEAEY